MNVISSDLWHSFHIISIEVLKNSIRDLIPVRQQLTKGLDLNQTLEWYASASKPDIQNKTNREQSSAQDSTREHRHVVAPIHWCTAHSTRAALNDKVMQHTVWLLGETSGNAVVGLVGQVVARPESRNHFEMGFGAYPLCRSGGHTGVDGLIFSLNAV